MNARAHELEVREVISETADAVSLIFDIPTDLTRRFVYAPGQYLTLRVPGDRTGSVARCYSLSSSPHCGDRPTVTIKRTPGGYASNWLCDNVSAGDILTVLEPAGNFVPRTWNRDLLLCAAGSGITPIMSILKSALTLGNAAIALLYANRDRDSIIFAPQLRDLARRHPRRLTVTHWLESERGLPTSRDLATWARSHRRHDVYLCGPTGFTATVKQALTQLRIPDRAIHQEEYRSLTDNPFEHHTSLTTEPPPSTPIATSDAATVRVDIDGETHTLPWPRNKKLLDLLLDHGIDAPYVCRESACGTCICHVDQGRTHMLHNEALIDDELSQGYTLACQTLPDSDTVDITFE
ncbi:2Fe-2S iron-sulfur cluster binding domain-containing protein [Nocardia sp. ET3-3]|uniref:2Fe-2S iron-sulfur cluster binding domain-containing protein n=1 Tax=Nocardia terrae TaxID=2675851 RepID=A0A7K1UMZ9_9NOCA|nr:2Fe-2S iron-sulfur cluster binding domain-containing protein [Nocardia terrae]